MTTTPAVSVLMSVHDGLPWLREAVASVLAQTWGDFELLVMDDGSTDGSAEFLADLRDPRVRVERQPQAGLTVSLNRLGRRARAPLLARMDSDDICAPERLAHQLRFLARHGEVGLLGTAAVEIDTAGAVTATLCPPTEPSAIVATLIRRNPFIHSSVVVRREIFHQVGGYDERLRVAQDYDLWLRLASVTALSNLAEPLVRRRLRPASVSAARERERLQTEAWCRWRAVARGQYPWWCAVFAVRPLAALALPAPLRRAVRRARRPAPRSV